MTLSLDPVTLLPIRPDGMTDEQYKEELPDPITERYLQYLRGIKNRKGPDDCRIPIIELHPKGYPQLAAVMNSDEQFMIYRRFGHLQARILLNKQDELRQLWAQLKDLDEFFGIKYPSRLYCRERCDAECEDYKKLLTLIEQKYNEYVQLLTHAKTLANFEKPMNEDYLRLKNYVTQNATFTCRDREWIFWREDLITVAPSRDNTWLDAIVRKIPHKFPCRLMRYIFCTTELRQKTDPDTTKVFLSEPGRVKVVASWILLTTVLSLLIIPGSVLWYLIQLSTSHSVFDAIVAVLLVSTLIFFAALSLFTRASRHEVLAAAAGYCAVLVFFCWKSWAYPMSP